MNCPSCGASMKLEADNKYLSCSYCGHHHFPEPNEDGVCILAEHAGADCPVCRKPLVHASIDSARLLCCEACRGVLVSMDLFVWIVAHMRARWQTGVQPSAPAELRELDREVRCPHCHRKMDTHRYGGPGNVIIDNCPACQLNWLDYGEFRKIGSAPDVCAPASWMD